MGLGFAWLLRAGALPVLPRWEALAVVRPWTIVAYALIYLASLYLRSHRWAFLLAPIHPVPLRRVLAVSFIGYGALVLLPFRLGEVVRPALIRKEGKLSGWSATGTIAAERVIDGLVLSAGLFVALALDHPLSPLPDHIGDLAVPVALVPAAAYSALVVFASAFAVLGAFYFFRAQATRALDAVLGLVSKSLARRVSSAASRLADGLHFLPRPAPTAAYFAATVLYFGLNAAGVELLLWGAGIAPVDFTRACVLVGVLNLGVLLPNAPGYFGAFQLSIYAGLAMYYPPERIVSAGSAVVFLLYVLQMGLVIVAAALALFVEHVSPSEALAAGEAEPESP